MYRDLSVMTNKRKTPHSAQRSETHLFCVFFSVCGRQKPENPQIEPHMAQDAITQGGIGGLGSLMYICGMVMTTPLTNLILSLKSQNNLEIYGSLMID